MASRGSSLFRIIALIACGATAWAQDVPLTDYFGFEPLEVVKIDKQAGPLLVADMNSDGLDDLVVVNNFKSRIEVHYQKAGARPEDVVTLPTDANELPEHWRFRRQYLSVSHAVTALTAHDFDHDGRIDLIYAGSTPELVFVRQTGVETFDVTRKHTVKGLNANPIGFAVANVIGNEKLELLALVGGDIHVWPLEGDNIGKPVKLVAGGKMIAFFVEDFDGDGRQDVAGVLAEDPGPVRLWLGGLEEGQGVLGAQVRFEMPALREFEPVRLPRQPAALMAIIERASRRLVVSRVKLERVEESGDRDAALQIYSFTDPGNRKRALAVVDVDGDGLLDLVATDTDANALVVYRQAPAKGLQPGESYPCFAELGYLVAGNVDADRAAELFVLSEKEGVVGRCDAGAGGTVPFPSPVKVSSARTPVALNLVELQDGPRLAVVAKDGRNFVIDLIDMQGNSTTIDLGSQSRSPQTIISLDADQDGLTDLLLFTPEKPMMMLRAQPPAADAGAGGFKLTESKDMGQFGLVQAATADNTAVFDVDGDGRNELLIADRNYVRAVRYEPQVAATTISAGWQVVAQINARDRSSKLVSLAVLGQPRGRIVAADKENSRLIIMDQAEGASGPVWREAESVNLKGFSFHAIYPGAFSGDGKDNILAVGGDGFAVVQLTGQRVALDEVAAWRTDKERRVQHELACGDVNGDGYADMVSLDAGEQMCEIFTFTQSQRLLYAAAFPIFESKIFSSGEPREFEPRQLLIADITGDGGNDILMLAHDRVLIYPQMTASPSNR